MRARCLGAHLAVLALGSALGFSLSDIGFTDFGEVHRMLTLADLRMILVFAVAVVLCGVGHVLLRPLASTRILPLKPVHRGTVPGALLFGAGWALTGACPAVPLVQAGEGQLPGLVIAAGLVAGVLLWQLAQARWLRWDVGSCDS
jgi:uncharacterized protein